MQVTDMLLVGTVHADLVGFDRLEKILAHVKPRVIAMETSARRAALYAGRFDYDALAIYREAHARYVAILSLYLSQPARARRARERYSAVPVEWTERQMAAMEAGAFVLAACYGFELKVAQRYVAGHPGTELRFIDLPERSADDVDAIQRSKAGDAVPSLRSLRFAAEHRALLEHGLVGALALVRELQDAYYRQADGVLRRHYEENVANWHNLDEGDHYRRAMYHPRREPYMAAQLARIRRTRPHARSIAIVGATHVRGLARLLAPCEPTSVKLDQADTLLERAA